MTSSSSSTKTLSTRPTQGFSVLYNKIASQIPSFASSVSGEMSSVNAFANPQAFSNPKSSNERAQEPADIAPTTSRAASPAPLSAQPTEIEYDPNDSVQPTVAELQQLGIKVRDFAYESVLPAVPSYRRQARQVQLGPRPLKRARLDGEEDTDDPSSQRSNGYGEEDPAGNAERRLTEPPEKSIFAIRKGGYSDLNAYGFVPESQQSEWSSPSHSQPPLVHGLESQGSEPYITTPFVTPNGSLQWDAKDMPASQFDTNMESDDDDELIDLGPGLAKKLSLHNTAEGIHESLEALTPLPLSPLPSIVEPQTPPAKKQRRNPSPTHNTPKPSLPPSPSPSPRYHFRARRPTPTGPPSPPPKKRSRSRPVRRLAPPEAEHDSGPAAISVQSSQSRSRSISKSKNPGGSRSSSRPSRRRR